MNLRFFSSDTLGRRKHHPMRSRWADGGRPYSMEAITDSFSSLVGLFLVSVVAVLIVHQTFKRLRTAASNPLPLEVQMEELGGFGYRQLVLIRLLTLFVEIMMIRRVSSEVRILRISKTSC